MWLPFFETPQLMVRNPITILRPVDQSQNSQASAAQALQLRMLNFCTDADYFEEDSWEEDVSESSSHDAASIMVPSSSFPCSSTLRSDSLLLFGCCN